MVTIGAQALPVSDRMNHAPSSPPTGTVTMIRHFVSDRRARALALASVVVLSLACSRPASYSPPPVAPEGAASAELARSGPSPADLRPGTRVRYVIGSPVYGVHTGQVARASADTLWLGFSIWRLGRSRAVPLASLRRLEYSPAGNTKLRKVVIGAVIGGAVGAVVGASVPPKECERCPAGEADPAYQSDLGFTPLLVGLYGAIAGGLGTAIIVPEEKWVRVELPRPR